MVPKANIYPTIFLISDRVEYRKTRQSRNQPLNGLRRNTNLGQKGHILALSHFGLKTTSEAKRIYKEVALIENQEACF